MADDKSQIAVELNAIDNATAVFTKIQGGMDSLAKSGAMLKDVLGALGIGFGMEQILSFAEHAIKLGEDLEKLHLRTGFTVEGLSELRLAANLAGVDFDSVGSAVTKFEKNLVAASNETTKMGMMMTALGVDITQGPQKAMEQFLKTANEIDDPALKVAAFKEAFGKTGDQMILVAEDMERAEKMAKALGLTMSADTAKAAKELADNMKLLKTGGDTLAVLLLGEMSKGLLTMSGNLVQAAENGHKLWGVMNEISKLAYALIGTIPGLDKFAFTAFQELDSLGRQSEIKPIRGPDGKPLDSGAMKKPDEDNLRKILSGSDKGKEAAPARDKELEAALALQKKQVEQFNHDYWESIQERNEVEQKLIADGQIAVAKEYADASALMQKQVFDEIDAEQDRAIAAGKAYLDALNKDVVKTKGFMQEMGFSMVSSFENAVLSGKKFSALLQDLLKDLAKIALRQGVTDPLAGSANAFVKSLFGNDEGGATQLAGPRASGGPVSEGSSYLVGENGPEIFTPGGGGMITPNSAMGGGVSMQINFNGGPPIDPQAFLAQVVPIMKSIAQGTIQQQLRPGGALS